MRARLKGDAEGRPMMFISSACSDFIRTVPVLQHDPRHPEDLDTEAEDHIADETRYACVSRPWIPGLQIHNVMPQPADISRWFEDDGASWRV